MSILLKRSGYYILGLIATCIIISVVPLNHIGIKNTCMVEASVKLSTKSINVPRGSKYTIKVTGTTRKVKWYTSRSKVATVKNGVITAKKAGSAIITAKVGSKKYTCKVNVLSCKINSNQVVMTKGKSYTLKVSGTSLKPTYSSSNKRIASVNKKSGKIIAKQNGTTIIWVKVGSKKFPVKVTVETPSLSKTSLTLFQETNYMLKLSSKRAVKWSSSNLAVASVNSTGIITARSSGKAIIKATLNDQVYACTVTVESKTIVTWPSTISIGLGQAKTYTLVVGDGFSIKAEGNCIDLDLTPEDYYPGQMLTVVITGTRVGVDELILKDSNGLRKTVKVQVTANTLPASSIADTIGGATIDSIAAYKGAGSTPWIQVKGKITCQTTSTSDLLYIGYTFYNKSNQSLKTFYYPIENPIKGASYEFSHSFNGELYNWTTEVSSLKVISVD